MEDSFDDTGLAENEISFNKPSRSRPVTPNVVLTLNRSGSRGSVGSRSGVGRPSSRPRSKEKPDIQIKIYASPEQSKEFDQDSNSNYGLKILGCDAQSYERPLSAASSHSRLRTIDEDEIADFHTTTTDEHGDIMHISDNFQKLKIGRNQYDLDQGGAGDASGSRCSEANNNAYSAKGPMKKLPPKAVIVVPKTHRSSPNSRSGRPPSSGDEVPVHPAVFDRSKLSRTPRKKRINKLAGGVGSRLQRSVPDAEDDYLSEDDSTTPVQELYSAPSTARSTYFHDRELGRPATASSEILRSGILASEEVARLRQLKELLQIDDADEDWYYGRQSDEEDDDEEPWSGKANMRRLTKLFYQRNETQSRGGLLYTHKLMLFGLHNRLEDFALLPVPPGSLLKMRVTRVKKGIAGKLYPIYYMHLERENCGDRKCLIMVAKKHKLLTGAGYILSSDPAELSPQSEYCVGKISSNFIGTEFTLYSGRSINSNVPHNYGVLMNLPKAERFREELASVIYDTNVLGFKGPRKMKIVVPKMKNLLERDVISPKSPEETLLNRYSTEDNCLVLKNKDPIWSRESHSYILNFSGRVHTASVKNFQIVSKEDEERVLLQFGRASENTFSLDFQYPFCPLQAFAIALTSFDSKLACE